MNQISTSELETIQIPVQKPYIEQPESIEQPENKALGFLTLAEIENLPRQEERFMVDGLLSSSGTSLLTGKPKIGKSQMVRQIAACVITGTSFLTREARQGDVVYFALEEKATELSHHFRMLGVQEGLYICSDSDPHNPVPLLERAMQQSTNVRLIIIDPLVDFVFARDWSAYGEMTKAMRPLRDFARKNDVHLLAVHHANKRESEDPRDATLGSTALNGVVDTIMPLVERRGVRILSAFPRYAKPMPPTMLDFDEETLTVKLSETAEQARFRKENQLGNRIAVDILTLLTLKTRLSQAEIIAEVRGKTLQISDKLKELTVQGTVAREGSGNRADPHYFTIASVPTEDQAVLTEANENAI